MCKTSRRCGTDGCGRDHHSLLHVVEVKGPGNTIVGSCLATTHETELVHLGVLPVRVRGPRGTETVYALLDSGSDISLIEEDLADQIGIQGTKTALNLSTVSGFTHEQSRCYRMSLSSPDGTRTVKVDKIFGVKNLNLGRSVYTTELAARK